MCKMSAGLVLLLFAPFLLSLMGRAMMPKVLCLVVSLVATLLAVEFYTAVLPWAAGMAIAAISVRERCRRHEKRGGIAPAAPNA